MELDELKNTWMVLNNRLQMNEVLNDRIIEEMLQSKTNKALKSLSNFEWIQAFGMILGLPFLIFMYNKHLSEVNPKVFLMFKYLMIFCILSLFVHIPFQIWKLYTLMQIDFSGIINKNIKRIERYNIQIKREKIYSGILLFIIITAFLVSIVIIHFPVTEIWRPIFVICVLGLAVFRFF